MAIDPAKFQELAQKMVGELLMRTCDMRPALESCLLKLGFNESKIHFVRVGTSPAWASVNDY